jgi:hypothetical protein
MITLCDARNFITASEKKGGLSGQDQAVAEGDAAAFPDEG